MHKFVKKNKDGKKQTKKETKVEKEKQASDDEEEQQPITIDVQLNLEKEEKEQQAKAVKAPAKKIDEAEIDYAMENPNIGKAEVRISWVPQQGGVVKKFDYEKQKDHFVAIGEEYKPDPEEKKSNFVQIGNQTTTTSSGDNRPRFTNSSVGGGNMSTMEKTAQQIKEEQIQAKLAGLRAPTLSKQELQAKKKREAQLKNPIGLPFDGQKKIPTFTKGNPVQGNTFVIEKTKQQLLEQQLASKGQFQTTFVSRQQKAAKQAERKKREEEAAKVINFGTGERKVPTFTSGNNNNWKALEKTPQQLAEQKIEEQLKSKNLAPKLLSKDEIQQNKLKRIEREQQQVIEKKVEQAIVPPTTEGPKPPRFFNSSKTGDQPQFVDLK